MNMCVSVKLLGRALVVFAVKLFGGFALRDGRRGVIHCAYTLLSPWRLSVSRAGFFIVSLRNG